MSLSPEVWRYLARIGSRGGRKSRRSLTPAQARQIVKVREARRLFRKHYARCFWSYNPQMHISIDDVKWVGEQLLKHGGMSLVRKGTWLCQ